MSCLITRDQATGEILSVTSPSGLVSETYTQIASLPFITNEQDAIDIFASSIKEDPSLQEGLTPVVYSTSKGEFPTFKDALANSSGQAISVSIGKFNITSISSATDGSVQGNINSLILEDKISEKVELRGGVATYNPKGSSYALQLVNSNRALEVLNENSESFHQKGLSIQPVQVSKSEIKTFNVSQDNFGLQSNDIADIMNDTKEGFSKALELRSKFKGIDTDSLSPLELKIYNKVNGTRVSKKQSYPIVNTKTEAVIVNSKGNYQVVSQNDLGQKEIDSNPDTAIPKIVDREQTRIREDYTTEQNKVDQSKILNPSQKSKIFNQMSSILSRLGIRVQSIEQYKENYRVKNGSEVSVNGIADIANGVIALSEDENIDQTLSEEVSHFLVEAYNNQQEIDSLLPQVENTEEWAEHSANYMAIYSKEGLVGEELNQKVRREVLGKIIASNLTQRLENQPTNLVQESLNIVRGFISTIKAFFSPNLKTSLQGLIDNIVESSIEESKMNEAFSKETLSGSRFDIFYSAEASNTTNQINKAFSQMQKQAGILRDSANSHDLSSKLDQMQRNMEVGSNLLSFSNFFDMANSIYKDAILKLNKLDAHQISGKKGGGFISQVEFSSASLLVTETRPMLSEMIQTVQREDVGQDPAMLKTKATLLQNLSELSSKINRMEGRVSDFQKIAGLKLIEELSIKYQLPQNQIDNISEQLKGQVRDMSILMSNFGNMQNASNPIIKLLNLVISSIYSNVNTKDIKVMGDFESALEKLGFKNSKGLNFTIKRFSDGKASHYNKSVIDWASYYKAKEEAQLNAYNAVIKQFYPNSNPVDSFYKIGKGGNLSIGNLSIEARNSYREKMMEWSKENDEPRNIVSYADQRNDMFKSIETNGVVLPNGQTIKMKIPDATKDQLGDWARRRRAIKEQYISKGVIDYSKMSEVDLEALENIKREKKAMTSTLDNNLEKKVGADLEMALALQAISAYYANNNTFNMGSKKLLDEFRETLKSFTKGKTGNDLIKANRDAYDFFMANSGVNFNDNFWSIFSNTSKVEIKDEVQSFILNNFSSLSGDQIDALNEVADNLTEDLAKKKEFLKQYSDPKSPAEINVDMMTDFAQQSFRDLEDRISEAYSVLGKISKNKITQTSVATESTTNESYKAKFQEAKSVNPTLSENDFIFQHLSTQNKVRASTFQRKLYDYIKGSEKLTDKSSFKIQLAKALGIDPMSSAVEVDLHLKDYILSGNSIEALLVSMNKNRLPSYFKRFSPMGYDSFLTKLKSGDIRNSNNEVVGFETIADILLEEGSTSTFPMFDKNSGTITSVTQFIDARPEFEWFEETNNANSNPNYIHTNDTSTHYGGDSQPRMDKYLDTEFNKRYNIDLDVYRKTGETVSKGNLPLKYQQELAAFNLLRDMTYKSLTSQGVQNKENSYKRPQVGKSSLENAEGLIKGRGKVLKYMASTINNAKDKMVYGQDVSGQYDSGTQDVSNLKIPLLNIRNIEDAENLSEDVLHSYYTHLHNAHMYEERSKAVGKINQLESTLLGMNFKGKEAKESNTYKMFKNGQKAYIYGVQELAKISVPVFGKTVDLTGAFRTFSQITALTNVGMNPAVSITAGSSGAIFSLTEGLVGQYVGTDSYKWASAKYAQSAKGLLNDVGKVNKTSEMYKLGEMFGVYKLSERVVGSNYNKMLRTVFKGGIHSAAHLLTEFMTHPYAPTAMYAVMHDLRYVPQVDSNGDTKYKLLNYNAFASLQEKNGVTVAEMKKEWNNLEKNAVSKNVSVDANGNVKYSDNLIDLWTKQGMDSSQINQEKEFITHKVTTQVENLVSKIDAKMPESDKAMASKHVLMNFLMTHREWLTINVQNRFKSEQENFITGNTEQGSYIAASKIIARIYGGLSIKNMSQNGENLQKIWNSLSKVEKVTFRRVAIESAISMALMLLGGLMVAPSVDDDENKDNSLIQYAGYMYFRLSSEQMSSGILGVLQMKDVLDTPIVAYNSIKEILRPSNYSLEEVDRRVYKGHSKLFKLVAKQTFLRHYIDTKYGINEKSKFFRLQNDLTLPFMHTKSREEQMREALDEEEDGDDEPFFEYDVKGFGDSSVLGMR